MTPPEPDSTIDRDRRVLDLLERCLGAEPARVEELLAEVEPGVAAEVRRTLSGGLVGELLETPPSNPLEAILTESILPAGTRVGAYEIIGPIGAGGAGRVYLARQEAPSREVALKTLRSELVSAEAARRFRTEAELLALLDHPHVARIFEAGIARVELRGRTLELPYFALEHVRGGRPITEWVRRERPTRAELLLSFRRVCEAVQHAHQRGVIHRDLKPGNVLVDEHGAPKVIDFGIARAEELEVADGDATRVGQVLGTPSTMAPEQLLSDARDLDSRVDVFALGAILYQLLCDRPLRELSGLSTQAAMRKALIEEPPRPRKLVRRMPADLEAIVLKAIQPDREQRYPSSEALSEDLRRFLNHDTVRAKRPTVWHQVGLFVRRNPIFSAVLCALALALVGATALAQRNARRANVAEVRADAARLAVVDANLDFITEFANKLGHIPGAVEERVDLAEGVMQQLRALRSGPEVGVERRATQARLLIELGSLFGKPGRTNLGRREQALAAYAEAALLAREVARERPLLGATLEARVERFRGQIALFEGDTEGALEHEQLALDLLADYSGTGFDPRGFEPSELEELRKSYREGLNTRMGLHMDLGQTAEAIEAMRENVALFRADFAAEPEDVYAELNFGSAESNLAIALIGNGQPVEALEFLDSAIEIYRRRLDAGDVPLGKMGPELARLRIVRAEALGRLGEWQGLLESAEAVRSWAEPAFESDPGDVHNLTMLLTAFELGSLARIELAREAAASGDRERARELFERCELDLERALELEDRVRENGVLFHAAEQDGVESAIQRLEQARAALGL